MRVKGIFCQTKAATNEEYRKELKRKNWKLGLLSAVGIAVFVTAFLAQHCGYAELPEYMMGVYCGAGAGIALAGLALIVKNMILLGNEERLKQSRLKNSDERIQEIGTLALKAAFQVMMLVALAGGLIGGIFYPILVKAVLFITYVFLFSYLIACRVYEKRM